MKKITFLLIAGLFLTISSYAQMKFSENLINKSAFDLTKSVNIINSFAKKSIIVDENHEIAKTIRSKKTTGFYSDEGFYINAGLGYGLGLASQNIASFYDSKMDTSGFITDNQVNVSLGKGLNFKLAFGYMINSNIGFELGLSYLMGANNTATQVKPVSPDINETYESVYYSSMFMVNPSIVVASGMEIINPYAKFGINMGFGSFSNEQSLNNDTINLFQKTQFDGGVAIGFNAAVGCNFVLNNYISLFAEFNMLNMSYAPDKSEIIEYTAQGTDMLPIMTINEKQTNYVETITNTGATVTDPDIPNKALKQSWAFGNFGLNIGIKIKF